MNIYELIEELDKLKEDDPETAHINADRLLLKFINDNRVTKAFDKIEKWYS